MSYGRGNCPGGGIFGEGDVQRNMSGGNIQGECPDPTLTDQLRLPVGIFSRPNVIMSNSLVREVWVDEPLPVYFPAHRYLNLPAADRESARRCERLAGVAV